jgi:hypothetical protein
MKDDLDRIGEYAKCAFDEAEKVKGYAKCAFDEAEKVKGYANFDIGNGMKSYQLGIGILILSLFLCLILC